MKPKKIKQTALKVFLITFFVVLFLVGVLPFLGSLPSPFQTSIIKINRKIENTYHRILLTFPKKISEKQYRQSINILLKNNEKDVLGHCIKNQYHKNESLAHQSKICVLRLAEGKSLLKLKESYFPENQSAAIRGQFIDALFVNPHSTLLLKELLDNEPLDQETRLEILGKLMGRGENPEDFKMTLFNILSSSEDKERDAAFAVLSQYFPDDKRLIEEHREKVKSGGDNVRVSLTFLAYKSDDWLTKEFWNIYLSLDQKDQVNLLKLTKFICPQFDQKKWGSYFFSSNNFLLKKAIFESSLQFRVSNKKEWAEKLLKDLKLRESEREELKKILDKSNQVEMRSCR